MGSVSSQDQSEAGNVMKEARGSSEARQRPRSEACRQPLEEPIQPTEL